MLQDVNLWQIVARTPGKLWEASAKPLRSFWKAEKLLGVFGKLLGVSRKLLWEALGVSGKLLGAVFREQFSCATLSFTGRPRGRQAVFREQFLCATLSFTGRRRGRQAVFREQFSCATLSFTGRPRGRQAVFREQFFCATLSFTGRRRGRQAVFREQFFCETLSFTGRRRGRLAVFREQFFCATLSFTGRRRRREEALGYQAVRAVVRATRWWTVGRSRVSFEGWDATSPNAPTPRGTAVDEDIAWYEAWWVRGFLDGTLLNVLFWQSAVAFWHRFWRPAVASLEMHGYFDLPGGFSAVVLFEFSVIRAEDGTDADDGDDGSLPSTHSVFGTSEEEEDEQSAEDDVTGEEEPLEEVDVEVESAEVVLSSGEGDFLDALFG
eukprot:s132_g20.t1